MDAPPDLAKLRIDRGLAPIRSRRRRKWLWLGGLGVLVLAGALWYGVQPRAVTVQTTPVVTTYPSQQFVVLNATGYVVAQRKAAIASKATGRLEWLGVAEGSRVKAGDVIARLDNRDVVAQAQSAEANVQAARAALEQAQAEERDAARIAQAQPGPGRKGLRLAVGARHGKNARRPRDGRRRQCAARRSASPRPTRATREVGVDYTLIRAPFDGVILSKSANVGDMVTPFSSAADSKGAVVTMADMSTLEVEADVSESSLAKVSVGQPCEITLDALPDARFRGRISRMVPTVDRAKATVMTKVQLRRDRSARPAGDEREGRVPVAGRDARAAEAVARRQSRTRCAHATARSSCSSCATTRRSRCP